MICQLCGMRPVEAIVKTDEGEANLCGVCFQRYRNLKAIGEIEGLSDYFFLFDELANPLNSYMSRMTDEVCPECGMSLSRLKNDYKFGCAKCYDYFSNAAREYFDELGGQEYKGRYFGYENKRKGRRLSEMTEQDIPFLLKKLQEARDNREQSRAEAIDRRIRQLKGGKQ